MERSRGRLRLQWYKCAGGEWCRLDEVGPHDIDDYGVFVVWQPGGERRAPAVLYIGSGILRQEIAKYRRDHIAGGTPDQRLTWATVDPLDADGVAAYLYQQLRPFWGEWPRLVAVRPVNLPQLA